jgi:hypothetical protein
MFGFSHPTIAKLIQELPGAEKCTSFVAQNFLAKEPSTPKKRKVEVDTPTTMATATATTVNPKTGEEEQTVTGGDSG